MKHEIGGEDGVLRDLVLRAAVRLAGARPAVRRCGLRARLACARLRLLASCYILAPKKPTPIEAASAAREVTYARASIDEKARAAPRARSGSPPSKHGRHVRPVRGRLRHGRRLKV